jgi:hypothetical protein
VASSAAPTAQPAAGFTARQTVRSARMVRSAHRAARRHADRRYASRRHASRRHVAARSITRTPRRTAIRYASRYGQPRPR